ncbi:unnamed protein product [Caretta caretta]
MGEPDKAKCSTPLIEILQYYVELIPQVAGTMEINFMVISWKLCRIIKPFMKTSTVLEDYMIWDIKLLATLVLLRQSSLKADSILK